MKELKNKIDSRTATREEYNLYEWNKKMSQRRREGVKDFWNQERERIISGERTTRNWSQEQIADILSGKTPKYNGKPIQGHHAYSVLQYPQLANRGEALESGSGNKPYTNSRPSYGKNQVNEVWENAKDPITGKVYDPSGVEITWDKTKSRNGQWDMGHIPGEKYSEMHQLYMDDVISKDEFLEWYRNPKNYRPELPGTNRSHKYE